jgi:hypothetical protein
MAVDTQVAERFGRLVAQGDYAAAHSLLTEAARAAHPPVALQQAVEEMIAIASSVVLINRWLADAPVRRVADPCRRQKKLKLPLGATGSLGSC